MVRRGDQDDVQVLLVEHLAVVAVGARLSPRLLPRGHHLGGFGQQLAGPHRTARRPRPARPGSAETGRTCRTSRSRSGPLAAGQRFETRRHDCRQPRGPVRRHWSGGIDGDPWMLLSLSAARNTRQDTVTSITDLGAPGRTMRAPSWDRLPACQTVETGWKPIPRWLRPEAASRQQMIRGGQRIAFPRRLLLVRPSGPTQKALRRGGPARYDWCLRVSRLLSVSAAGRGAALDRAIWACRLEGLAWHWHGTWRRLPDHGGVGPVRP